MTKILTSFITVTFAIIGGLWTAYTILNTTMDSKVANAKVDIQKEMDLRKAARDAEITLIVGAINTRFDDHRTHFDKRLDTIEKLVK
jgi:hypothetical protein